jgi:hypothetical protein
MTGRPPRDVRARRLASRAYRRAARALAPILPAGSEDHNVATFDALQHEAFTGRGWPGLWRVWLAESAAVLRLWRNGRRGPPPTWQGAIMSSVQHDLRDAWRAIVRTPSYTAIVVATLALGIGVNTAIFSVMDTLLLKSLPYAEADRLVRAAEWPKTGGNFTVAPDAFLHWRDAASSFLQLEARAGRALPRGHLPPAPG